ANALNSRGVLMLDTKNYKEALADFTKALTSNRQNGMIWFNRGIANRYLGDNKQACDDWKKAVQLGETNAQDALTKFCK
ncbi:MAG: tetratricopeptide repeat protein, partial [Candidatus Kapaibacterium sp.]